MRVLALVVLLPFAAVAEDCPAPPDHAAELGALLKATAAAPDAASARGLMNELWLIWTDAPDERSQRLLESGMSRREAYDFAGAEAIFDELVDYCPGYAEGWNQRAFIRFLRENYAEAVDDLERALELSPDHIAAKAGLALSLMRLGRMEAGQSVLREAVAMNPWLPERGMLLPEPKGEEL